MKCNEDLGLFIIKLHPPGQESEATLPRMYAATEMGLRVGVRIRGRGRVRIRVGIRVRVRGGLCPNHRH